MTGYCVEDFLSHSTETFRRGTLLCCVSEKFWQRKNLWIKGRGKYQDFPSKILSHSAEKFRGGAIQCFEKIYA